MRSGSCPVFSAEGSLPCFLYDCNRSKNMAYFVLLCYAWGGCCSLGHPVWQRVQCCGATETRVTCCLHEAWNPWASYARVDERELCERAGTPLQPSQCYFRLQFQRINIQCSQHIYPYIVFMHAGAQGAEGEAVGDAPVPRGGVGGADASEP